MVVKNDITGCRDCIIFDDGELDKLESILEETTLFSDVEENGVFKEKLLNEIKKWSKR